MTAECTVETLPLSYWSTLHTVMPNEIVMFARFSGHGNSVYNIICLLTKKKKQMYIYFLAHEDIITPMRISNPLGKA